MKSEVSRVLHGTLIFTHCCSAPRCSYQTLFFVFNIFSYNVQLTSASYYIVKQTYQLPHKITEIAVVIVIKYCATTALALDCGDALYQS